MSGWQHYLWPSKQAVSEWSKCWIVQTGTNTATVICGASSANCGSRVSTCKWIARDTQLLSIRYNNLKWLLQQTFYRPIAGKSDLWFLYTLPCIEALSFNYFLYKCLVVLLAFSLESIQNRAVSCDDCYYRFGSVCDMTSHHNHGPWPSHCLCDHLILTQRVWM